MAKPDIKNGHIDIAHDLAEALMRINLSGYQYRVIWCIFRKTYGWHKSIDKISLTRFEIMTGIERRHINKALKDLETKNMIIIDRNTYINTYKFNANYDTWRIKTSAEIGTSAEISTKVVPNKELKLVPNMAHTKEKKETIQKKGTALYGAYRKEGKERDWSKVKIFKEDPYEYKPIPKGAREILARIIPGYRKKWLNTN